MSQPSSVCGRRERKRERESEVEATPVQERDGRRLGGCRRKGGEKEETKGDRV